MQKKVTKNVPNIQNSARKFTAGIRGGHPLAKHLTKAAVGLKRKVVKAKSMSAKKTTTRKRNAMGDMQKGGGMIPTFRPFMK